MMIRYFMTSVFQILSDSQTVRKNIQKRRTGRSISFLTNTSHSDRNPPVFILILYLLYIVTFFSCRVDRSFLPGQEGMETVEKEKQLKAGLDVAAGSGVMGHGFANYSPLKNTGIMIDTRWSPNSQVHSLALGYYKSRYKEEVVQDRLNRDVLIQTGKHWDVYGGATYLNTENSFIQALVGDRIFSVPPTTELFEISWEGFRYFLQGGFHVKSQRVGIDAVLRQSWLQARSVDIYGLNPRSELTPEEDLQSKNPRRYTEIGFKMNFGLHNTPFLLRIYSTIGARHTIHQIYLWT